MLCFNGGFGCFVQKVFDGILRISMFIERGFNIYDCWNSRFFLELIGQEGEDGTLKLWSMTREDWNFT